MRVQAEIDVAAPPDLIWDFVTDPTRYLPLHERHHALGGHDRAGSWARRALPHAHARRLGRGRRNGGDRRVRGAARPRVDLGHRHRPARPLAPASGPAHRTRVELRLQYGVARRASSAGSPSSRRRRPCARACAARCRSCAAGRARAGAGRGRGATGVTRSDDRARLFTETSFVVTATPNAFGRALLRLVKHVDTDARHWVRDRSGEPIAIVVPVTRRLRNAIDGYTRHDVLDASTETKLLALRAGTLTLTVDDPTATRSAASTTPPAAAGASSSSRSTPVSRKARASCAARRPRSATSCPGQGFPRGAYAYGVLEIADTSDATVATATNADMVNNVVEIAPALEPPLRLLAVAFACSLVDHRWMHVPSRSTP